VRISGLTREQSTEYPLEAVRELLVNAVAHRDYSIAGDSIHLHIFSNRLEVHSPGTLAGPVTLANLLEARFSRNPIIVQVLSDLGFIERLGYGLDRVVKVLAEHKMQSPGFQETAGTFRVILSSARTAKTGAAVKPDLEEHFRQAGLNPRQERAIEFLLENERITNSDYQRPVARGACRDPARDLVDLVKRHGDEDRQQARDVLHIEITPEDGLKRSNAITSKLPFPNSHHSTIGVACPDQSCSDHWRIIGNR
jgi:ATP-dependent DNA helicase RecG